MTDETEAAPSAEKGESAEPPEQQEPAAGGGAARRWSHEFRQELLGRLPVLVAPQWQASETLNAYQELQGIVDLDADAFLQPLANVADERYE
ncbi:MAG TPA: hypothetical protein VF521_16195 [Pyrinomonadaceae bacterium]|jgi:hypothetical protein